MGRGLRVAITSERSSACISFLSRRDMDRCVRPCRVERLALDRFRIGVEPVVDVGGALV
jgi:hypothetical protein